MLGVVHRGATLNKAEEAPSLRELPFIHSAFHSTCNC